MSSGRDGDDHGLVPSRLSPTGLIQSGSFGGIKPPEAGSQRRDAAGAEVAAFSVEHRDAQLVVVVELVEGFAEADDDRRVDAVLNSGRSSPISSTAPRFSTDTFPGGIDPDAGGGRPAAGAVWAVCAAAALSPAATAAAPAPAMMSSRRVVPGSGASLVSAKSFSVAGRISISYV